MILHHCLVRHVHRWWSYLHFFFSSLLFSPSFVWVGIRRDLLFAIWRFLLPFTRRFWFIRSITTWLPQMHRMNCIAFAENQKIIQSITHQFIHFFSFENINYPFLFPNFQLCIPALCNLSLIVSTLQFKPSAGATSFAAVRGFWVAIAIIASSCSLVVIRRLPFLSFVCTLPSLCHLSSHLFTVRSYSQTKM